MLHLLRVEWLKVKNYRTFWILLAMTIVSIPGLNYAIYDLSNNSFPKGKGVQSIVGSPFGFPDVWQTVSWNSSMLFIIPAILVITLTTNEFTYKTHRQNIIDGWSRGRFIGIKLTGVFLLSVLTTIVVLEQVTVGIIRGKYNLSGANYLPEEVTDRLIPFPYAKGLITSQGGGNWEN